MECYLCEQGYQKEQWTQEVEEETLAWEHVATAFERCTSTSFTSVFFITIFWSSTYLKRVPVPPFLLLPLPLVKLDTLALCYLPIFSLEEVLIKEGKGREMDKYFV